MRTVRFVATGAPFDITATRRPPEKGTRVWVIIEDATDPADFEPTVGWLELPEELHGLENELVRGLEIEVGMRVQMGPERDRVEAVASMLQGDGLWCAAVHRAPIPFESPRVPRRVRELVAGKS